MESEKQTEEISVVQERLNWQVAWRDDVKVAQALYAGETIDEMHHLSDAGLLDEFFAFSKGEAFSGTNLSWKDSLQNQTLSKGYITAN